MKTSNIPLKKILKLLILFSLLIAFFSLTINLYILKSTNNLNHAPQYYSAENSVDAIIVLGAAMYKSGPSLMLRDRLDAAIVLYEAGVSERILVSGDHGKTSYNEVQGMREYLLNAGIADEDIFMDHAGFNTYSSMYRAKDVFLVKSAIISTQEFHLPRAVYLANRLGLKANGVICDQHDYFFLGRNKAREFLARVKDWLQAEIFQPEPQYLGEPISIHGSGLATHD